jgi:hypothetical protein
MAETVIPKIGLTASQWNTYKAELFKKEANPTAGYQSIGGAGNRYIGGYQISDSALETAGYLRSKSAGPTPGFAWKNDQNWLKPNGDPITPGIRNYQDFLNNPQAQDDALLKFTQTNARSLTNYGLINENTPVSQRAGELAAAHLLGPAGRNEKGIDGVDGFNTPARKYYNDIGKAVGGGQTNPPPPVNAAGTKATAGRTASGQGGSSASGGFVGKIGSALSNSNNAIPGAVAPRIARGGSSTGDEETKAILLPNPLEPFQSFNYLFTFSSLTADAVNFPTTSYLQGNPGRVIFSSAGRYAENRVATAYQNPDNPSGKYDFFIDNVVMKHLVVPSKDIGSTNLLTIDFEVIEPYSVGQFLQSCQIAAFANGHYSYIDSPFLLTLEFRGYIDDASVTIENTTRYMPVKFRSVTVAMTESGTRYQVSVIAWGDQAFDDEFNKLKQDTVISGKTVVEKLQSGERSLQQVVNKNLKDIAEKLKEKAYVPDEIVIVFPTGNEQPAPAPSNAGATTSSTGSGDVVSRIKLNRDDKTSLIVQAASAVNDIGKSAYNFDAATGGDIPKQPDAPEIVKNFLNKKHSRSSFNNDTTQREFTFRKDTSIVNAITEALLMSEYCAKLVKGITDSDGYYDWFRIESQVYMLTPNENNKAVGIFPKLFVYRIVPYKVHMSKFQSPDVTTKGYEQLANAAVKEYNYIYTGKNVDILDFKLNLNVNFASNILADGLGEYSASPLLSKLGKSGAAFDEKSTAFIPDPQKAASGEGGGDKGLGISRQAARATRWKTSDGAGLADDYRTLVARVFQDRMLNSEAEKVSAKMTILGDPYYISYSGIGNFSDSDPSSRNNVTGLGSLDYQKGEVDIIFNFLTPVDLLDSGRLFFEGNYDTILKVPFSGLYFVRLVTSTFSKGKFTQELDLVRRPNQNTKDTLNTQLANIGGTGVKKDNGAVTAQEMIDEQNAIFEAGFENDNKSWTDSKEDPADQA